MEPLSSRTQHAVRVAYASVPGVVAIYGWVETAYQHAVLSVVVEQHDDAFYEAAFDAETTLEATFQDLVFDFHHWLRQDRDPDAVFNLPVELRVV